MIISPYTFIDGLKDKSYEELIKERDKLIRAIRYFEKHKKELAEQEEHMCPSPSTHYYWNLHYLSELIKLIIEKYEELDEE